MTTNRSQSTEEEDEQTFPPKKKMDENQKMQKDKDDVWLKDTKMTERETDTVVEMLNKQRDIN